MAQSQPRRGPVAALIPAYALQLRLRRGPQEPAKTYSFGLLIDASLLAALLFAPPLRLLGLLLAFLV